MASYAGYRLGNTIAAYHFSRFARIGEAGLSGGGDNAVPSPQRFEMMAGK